MFDDGDTCINDETINSRRDYEQKIYDLLLSLPPFSRGVQCKETFDLSYVYENFTIFQV